jgi:hypothetical protein
VIYWQAQRWLTAGCFEAIVHDLRVAPMAIGRAGYPSTVNFHSQTQQCTPESGARPGHNRAKRKRGSKSHAAVAAQGQLLASHATPAGEQYRAR